MPGESTPQSQFLHNAAHVPAYGILTLLFILAWPRIPVFGVILTAFLFGVLNEIIQSFVPGRTASVSDLVLNLTGILIAFLLIYFWKGRVKA